MASFTQKDSTLAGKSEEAIPLTKRQSLDYASDEESDIEFPSELDLSPRKTRWTRAKSALSWARSIVKVTTSRSRASSTTQDDAPLLRHIEGLRGFAAFCAFRSIFATETQESPIVEEATLSLLPSVESSIALFLVISGYVLSYQLLAHRASSDYYIRLSSSLLRRWSRLYLPFFLVTFLSVPLIYLQIVPASSHTSLAQRQPNLAVQYLDWLRNCLTISNPTSSIEWQSPSTSSTHYGDFFWILPLQLRGSLALFIYILITSRLRTSLLRILFTLPLILALHLWNAPSLALFLYGFILANLTPSTSPPQILPRSRKPTSPASPVIAGPSSPISPRTVRSSPPTSSPSTTKKVLLLLVRPLQTRTPCPLPSPGTLSLLALLVGSYISLLLNLLLPSSPSLSTPATSTSSASFASWSPTLSLSTEHHALLFPGLGAAGLIFSLERLPLLRRLAGSGLGVGLGKIGKGLFWGHFFVLAAGKGLEELRGGRWEGTQGGWVGWAVVCGVAVGVGMVGNAVDRGLRRGVRGVERRMMG
ncbi:hypothetical protein KVT40_002573 [Elsinoe batatas]|uniref:Acyltransferase 3 domain-containing protein n=1 Tax=Elsinoe batatas TaxID=2601811 RepID=A0A8K0PIP0_9PEZI|nr:hypothetical protein KVT40_002573 [Elsinoe batatas]